MAGSEPFMEITDGNNSVFETQIERKDGNMILTFGLSCRRLLVHFTCPFLHTPFNILLFSQFNHPYLNFVQIDICFVFSFNFPRIHIMSLSAKQLFCKHPLKIRWIYDIITQLDSRGKMKWELFLQKWVIGILLCTRIFAFLFLSSLYG